MENLGTGFELMVVGMTTVFVILIVVIQLGRLLIALVNKYAPEVAQKPAAGATRKADDAQVDATTMAVLAEAVKQITGGKGRIGSVAKI